MRYYLALDSDGYLSSVFSSDCSGVDEIGTPFLYSLDGLDLSGERMNAYFWNGESLTFDDSKYAELVAQRSKSDANVERITRMDAIRAEITDVVLTTTINTIEVDDTTALRWVDFYPEWSDGTAYVVGFKVRYNDRLWRCVQAHTAQIGWEPINAPSLWEEICESHSGLADDPIPYNNNMRLENGKYYSQNGVVYICTRDTGIPVYNNLSDLVGLYVEIA